MISLRFVGTTILTALMLSISACRAPRPAVINHVVYFKLENPSDAPELISDCDRQLSNIPGVVSYFCGQHGDFGRTGVDRDYDVGFYVGFDSGRDYQTYLSHPQHIEVVDKWKSRWEWIRITDIIDNTP